MTRTSIVSLILAVLAIVAPMVAGHIPETTLQLIVSIASGVAIIAAHVVSALQPSSAQSSEARVAASAVVLREILAAKAAKATVAGAALLCLTLVGCNWLTANKAAISADATALATCEVNYLVGTASPTPLGAVTACTGLAIEDAISLFATLEKTVDDAGAPTGVALKIRAARAH